MKFKYRSVFSNIPDSDDLLIFRRPEIVVSVAGPLGSASSVGLVDTGADFTIFPKRIADYLGIPLSESKLTSAAAFGGQQLSLHEGEVTLVLSDSEERIEWRTAVCFFDFPSSEGEAIILGHSSFLDYFIATFDGEASELELKPTGEMLDLCQSHGPPGQP